MDLTRSPWELKRVLKLNTLSAFYLLTTTSLHDLYNMFMTVNVFELIAFWSIRIFPSMLIASINYLVVEYVLIWIYNYITRTIFHVSLHYPHLQLRHVFTTDMSLFAIIGMSNESEWIYKILMPRLHFKMQMLLG